MKKIAFPRELQAELQSIMAFVHSSEKPDRQVVAAKLRNLADRVAVRTISPNKALELGRNFRWQNPDHVRVHDTPENALKGAISTGFTLQRFAGSSVLCEIRGQEWLVI